MSTTKIKDVSGFLESLAPRSLQENYDNSGLLTGDPEWTVTGILVTLDCLENVVEEAIRRKANLIVAHHPIIFGGLKKLTGENYVERTILKAIKNDIAIYAIHTNLDNVLEGVNQRIARQIGLEGLQVLVPRRDTLLKLVTFVPTEHAEKVTMALHEAGAGNIGHYKNCSFRITGTGAFLPDDQANPTVGQRGQFSSVEEIRVEVILPAHLERKVIKALKGSHPYEEVAYYLTQLENENPEVGSGMMGELPVPMEPLAFLNRLKARMNCSTIRHTPPPAKTIKKVALCGGSGSFLLAKAIAAGADAFVSADFKYHEFFDADGRILVADIGHYESEQYTKALLKEVLSEKFPNFAINFSEAVTNPISYL